MGSFLVALLACLIWATEARNYTGCKVLQLKPENLEQLKAVHFLQEKYRDEIQISFWSRASEVGQDSNVLLCPLMTQQFVDELNLNKVSYEVQVEDIQPMIEHERDINAMQVYRRMSSNSTASFQDYEFNSYYSLDEIENFITAASRHKREVVWISDAGTTFENRQVKIIRLGKDTGKIKPAIWIDAGIHAREWIAPAAAMYMIYQLLTAKDNDTKALLEDYDWYFIPMLNPDGYAYTWQKDRLWRKNRSQRTLVCSGVDLNRNFDADFEGKKSSSAYPCSETYRGPKPFSEEETRIVRDYITSLKSRLKMVLTIHSYSQMWLFPYGHTLEKAPDHDKLLKVSTVAMDALTKLYGTKYRFGNIAKVIYPASGSLTDWAYDSAHITYSFAAELRDTGKFGFLLPVDQILPTCQEFWAAVRATIGEISKEP